MSDLEQDKGNQAASNSSRKDGVEQTHYANYKVPDEYVPSNKCHQCQRNKGRIVRCQRCTKWNFYDRWVKEEEPRIKHEKFSECCPICCDSCNCISCPRILKSKIVRCDICDSMFCRHKRHSKVKVKIDLKPNQKVGYSVYILHVLVPILKRINDEHIKEKEIESEIQGSSLLEVQLKKVDLKWFNYMQCDCCKTSFFDLHRSCPSCRRYNLCLQCCWELRDGNPHGNKEKQTDEWKCLDDGRIPCPPKSMGGCGCGILELMHIKPLDSIPKLLEKAEKLLEMHKLEEDMCEMPEKWCLCSDTVNGGDKQLRKAASRENSNDNDLYCPRAIDIKEGDLKHFQWHWSQGEPVIVSNVLETSLGLNAEPWVMSRAFYGSSLFQSESSNIIMEYREKYKTKSKTPKQDKYKDMTPRRFLDWCEVDITLDNWYSECIFDDEGWPTFESKEDEPILNLLGERSLLVGVEFIKSLPFKEYTSPSEGYLNLAVRLPKESSKPDIVPKIYIAYAINQEVERRDSFTKLHCEKSDVVNVLVNIPPVAPNRKKTNQMKKQDKAQDERELDDTDKTKNATSEEVGLNKQKGSPGISVDGSDVEEGGAVWDIFRREDTPKLQQYLNKHFTDFKDDFCQPLKQVIHPIHDQTFYLTMDHKRKLKEEFGIEPWTYVQKLGDAVVIPAGCPHQVRNLKSCIKVAVNFVSPENIGECIRLTEEFCLLPKNHRAKEDTLEVKKIVFHALEAAVEDLEKIVPKNSQYLENSQDHPHLQYHENSRVLSNINHVPIPQNLQSCQNMLQNKIQIDHDTTRSRPEYTVGNEGSGGIMKRSRTSEQGGYSVHHNPQMPNSGCPTAHRFIDKDTHGSEKKGKGKVSQLSLSSNEFFSQLRAIRVTRDNEVEAMKKRHEMEQKKEEREIKKKYRMQLNTLFTTLSAKENLSPEDEVIKDRLFRMLYGK